MAKKKNKKQTVKGFDVSKVFARSISKWAANRFLKKPRGLHCLHKPGKTLLKVPKLDSWLLKNTLAFECRSIEHQIIALRDLVQLKEIDFDRRYRFSKLILNCIALHHGEFYEGILFGSTTNGLGFRDSDVDLRLRPLRLVGTNRDGLKIWEPYFKNIDDVERVLSNIAFQTTLCNPAEGAYVPSNRCPVAKLTFVDGNFTDTKNFQLALKEAEEGLKYDISLSSEASLGTFNSYVLRFLCYLEPKFHLMATVLRHWSNVHKLILPGYLSSYALINMLIYFCQSLDEPLLPTYDIMRDLYFKYYPYETILDPDFVKNPLSCRKGIPRREFNCLLCLRKEFYHPSTNKQHLGVLILKFFEFYLKFPYTTHIINTRLGRALTHKEYETSNLFHPGFPIRPYLNIQDPFDLKHNLTSGMDGAHFQLFMKTIRYSYERLFKELMNNFERPKFSPDHIMWYLEKDQSPNPTKNVITDPRNWGINSLFVELQQDELNRA